MFLPTPSNLSEPMRRRTATATGPHSPAPWADVLGAEDDRPNKSLAGTCVREGTGKGWGAGESWGCAPDGGGVHSPANKHGGAF